MSRICSYCLNQRCPKCGPGAICGPWKQRRFWISLWASAPGDFRKKEHWLQIK